jgi:hypothetical protein
MNSQVSSAGFEAGLGGRSWLLLERGWEFRYVVTSQHDYSWIEGRVLPHCPRKGLPVISQNDLPGRCAALRSS